MYDHELFETFANKVHNLLITMFPDESPIQMEHIQGGSYNCVVRGMLVYDQQSPRRVPRCW
jgi:hypothetical protein